MRLGFLHHPLDFALVESGGRGDGDLLLLARGHVLGGHVEDAVGIDVESHLDLRESARCRRDPVQAKATQGPVVARQRTLALQHMDVHGRLVVSGRAEDLALLRGDGRVARNERGGDSAQRLHPERQWRDVEKHDVLDLARQHPALDGRAHRHHLVGIHALVGLLAEELLGQLLDFRHPRLPTDQDGFVDVGRGDARILHGQPAGLDGALDQVGHQRLELRAGERHDEVLGAASVGGDEGQVDLGLDGRAELDLGLLGHLLEPLQGHPVAPQIDALLLA